MVIVSFLKKAKKRILILVVDDEPTIVDMIQDFLKEEGFEVFSAGSASQALEEMKKTPADAVLLDIKLPDENGLKFLGKFKKLYPDTPVIILTGSGYDEEMMQTAIQNGASGYVSKETDMENMLVALKRQLK